MLQYMTSKCMQVPTNDEYSSILSPGTEPQRKITKWFYLRAKALKIGFSYLYEEFNKSRVKTRINFLSPASNYLYFSKPVCEVKLWTVLHHCITKIYFHLFNPSVSVCLCVFLRPRGEPADTEKQEELLCLHLLW